MKFVVEVVGRDKSTDTARSFWFCTKEGWTTRPTDTPPNTEVWPVVVNPGNYSRDLFQNGFIGGIGTVGSGIVEISNVGRFDHLFTGWAFDGQPVRIYSGPDHSTELAYF